MGLGDGIRGWVGTERGLNVCMRLSTEGDLHILNLSCDGLPGMGCIEHLRYILEVVFILTLNMVIGKRFCFMSLFCDQLHFSAFSTRLKSGGKEDLLFYFTLLLSEMY